MHSLFTLAKQHGHTALLEQMPFWLIGLIVGLIILLEPRQPRRFRRSWLNDVAAVIGVLIFAGRYCKRKIKR